MASAHVWRKASGWEAGRVDSMKNANTHTKGMSVRSVPHGKVSCVRWRRFHKHVLGSDAICGVVEAIKVDCKAAQEEGVVLTLEAVIACKCMWRAAG